MQIQTGGGTAPIGTLTPGTCFSESTRPTPAGLVNNSQGSDTTSTPYCDLATGELGAYSSGVMVTPQPAAVVLLGGVPTPAAAVLPTPAASTRPTPAPSNPRVGR